MQGTGSMGMEEISLEIWMQFLSFSMDTPWTLYIGTAVQDCYYAFSERHSSLFLFTEEQNKGRSKLKKKN